MTVVEANDTLLRKGGIQQRMRCSGQVATNIEEAFVTVEKLLEAIEAEDPLTEIEGVGPKTAEVIEDWYENREEREEKARSATVNRTSSRSMTISFHNSWADALGIDIDDEDNGGDA